MRNLGVSFRILSRPSGAYPPYHFRVVYTNTIHVNSLDLDGAGLFVWGGKIHDVYIGRLTSLTATEVHDTTETSNSLTVSSVTDDTLYICPGNKVRLSLPANIPPRARVVFAVEGTSVSPASGNFSIDSTLTIPDDIVVRVKAGTDINANGTLDTNEVTQALNIRTQRFGNAKVHARRTTVPEESLLPMHDEGGEHFDIGSTFEFVLVPSGSSVLGRSSLLKYALLSTRGRNGPIASGSGMTLNWTFGSNGSVSGGEVRYFLDSNDDGIPAPDEPSIESPGFS
jgi:hypothetical protein